MRHFIGKHEGHQEAFLVPGDQGSAVSRSFIETREKQDKLSSSSNVDGGKIKTNQLENVKPFAAKIA